jgi:hypothetical protein
LTVEPDTDGAPSEDPVDASDAVSAVSAALTAAGTADDSVVTIGDAVPKAACPVVDTTLGHTRMLAAGTTTAMRLRVGVTTNVSVVSVAEPEYVAENEPVVTELAMALNDPPVAVMSALLGVAPTNVTGTLTAEPETSVTPVATTPSVALVASTAAAIGAERTVVVTPSGAVTTTANRTEPDAGTLPPRV